MVCGLPNHGWIVRRGQAGLDALGEIHLHDTCSLFGPEWSIEAGGDPPRDLGGAE
jgi:hypothetical protein